MNFVFISTALFVLIGFADAFSLREVVDFKQVDDVKGKGCTCLNRTAECHTTENNLPVKVTVYERFDIETCSPIKVTDFQFGKKNYTESFVHDIQAFCEKQGSEYYCVNFVDEGADLCVYIEQPQYYKIGCVKQSCIKYYKNLP